MANKSHILKFRAVNRDTFEAIRDGKKKVETRAFTVKYKDIKTGDELIFSCGKDRFSKKVKKVKVFKSIADLMKKYEPSQINPKCKTVEELTAMYHSFPGYREKIKKSGLLAMELK
ncbi:MAG: ASCH domain-containing protein [Patescibacteria group bacterium]